MSQIYTYLKSQQAEMLNRLEQWVNHDSPTFNKPAVDAMGQMLVEAFTEAGAQLTAVHEQAEMGHHYTLTYGQGQSQILVLCHFDTVWPMGEARQRPFRIENGKALGPGVHDMKGGILIGLYALKALQHFGLTPRHRVVFLLTSDEEIGSPTSRPVIEAEGQKSSYCLVLEGSLDGPLTTWRKGVGRFDMQITGIPAHAGVEPEKGVSAIEELARQIQKLHAMTDLPRGITVNVGVVSGGERSNIVARHARAEIDLRVKTRQDGEELTRRILALQPEQPGCQLKITGGINRGPFEETPAGLALFEKARGVARMLGFDVGKTGSGGGSDGNFVAALGVPTLDGLGSLGGGAHALTEFTRIEGLPQRAALLAELLLQLD
ncbi:MAG: M20 family peptidase [Chloroflexi bacterium]|nr:MAG: M20 family peptidase [Chloroflexota bacterium]